MFKNTTLALASLAIVGSSIAAQSAPCLGLNDATNTVVGLITGRNSSFPGEWGWKYTPSSTIDVEGMKVFTGNNFTAGFMKIAIWSHDAVNDTPDAVMGEGTFTAPKGGNDWVGANLDQVVQMQSGTTYWVVWTEIGWSTPPFQAGGSPSLTPVRRFGTGPWSKSTATQGLKCRFFCDKIDVQGVTSYGEACSGSSTGIGTSFTNTPPSVGNADFRVEGTGLPADANSILAIGIVAAWPSISLGANAPGCFLNTDLALLVGGKTGTGNVRATSPTGHIQFNLGIPSNPALVGVYVGFQVATEDSASTNTLPMVFTNATRAVIF